MGHHLPSTQEGRLTKKNTPGKALVRKAEQGAGVGGSGEVVLNSAHGQRTLNRHALRARPAPSSEITDQRAAGTPLSPRPSMISARYLAGNCSQQSSKDLPLQLMACLSQRDKNESAFKVRVKPKVFLQSRQEIAFLRATIFAEPASARPRVQSHPPTAQILQAGAAQRD